MPHPNFTMALHMLEFCRFIYRAYAQTCVYPMDPFFEAHGEGKWQGARDRLIEWIHTSRGTPKELRKFDPIEYDLEHTPHPRRGVAYRGGTGKQPFILFHPRPLDKRIGEATGFDLTGKRLESHVIQDQGSTWRCCHFQGKTGMTQTYPTAGWPSWMGACLYDPTNKTMVIVFRGSRSGSGGRALAQAQARSEGNPDWVTDMNHLKGVEVERLRGAMLSCGFWYAYESCLPSLEAAFHAALGGGQLEQVFYTGHSLGGALAQCAYVDMAGGTFAEKTMARMRTRIPIHCYAISAPPICLGGKSKRTIEFCIDDPNIYHYFAANDSVHDSPEVGFSGASMASSLTSALTHPMTAPIHLGLTFKLACKESFPDAHEPLVVHKGIVKAIKKEENRTVPPDPEFWPLFDFSPLVPWGRVVQCAVGLEAAVVHALGFSTSKEAAEARANLWSSISKVKHEGGFAKVGFSDGEAFDDFDDACKLLHELGNPFGCDSPLEKSDRLKEIRGRLLHHYRGAGGHKASSSCMWTLLQHISVRQHEAGIH